MKYWILVFLAVFLINCTSQNRKEKSDSVNEDTIFQEGENEEEAVAVNYCSDLVKEILKSSSRYKQLTTGLIKAVKENGGTSVDIVLDKSPDPKKDNAMSYSANFELQIKENYPDRQVNVAHFTFDPYKKQLYEYDIVSDKLTNVDYNKQLLNRAADYCK